MVDASLTGSGSARSRTINVEVNLLTEWANARVATQLEVRRRIVMLVGVGVGGLVVLPMLAKWRGSVFSATNHVIVERDGLLKQSKALETEVARVTPSMDFAEMRENCNRYRNSLFSETRRFVDATPSTVQFESFKIEANGGEISFKVVANAGSAAEGRQFVSAASRGRNVTASNQTAVRQSQVLGADGIVFDYLKKVRVNK